MPERSLPDADPDDGTTTRGTGWTGCGGEGMVVKPLGSAVRGRRGLVQPVVKCRGPEYLRIIYGPEYTAPANLGRLRSRGSSTKRALALREFALARLRHPSRGPIQGFYGSSSCSSARTTMPECSSQKNNLKQCNCTYEPCARKGRCCECLHYHRRSGELPACYFPADVERTYDRSIERFIACHGR